MTLAVTQYNAVFLWNFLFNFSNHSQDWTYYCLHHQWVRWNGKRRVLQVIDPMGVNIEDGL